MRLRSMPLLLVINEAAEEPVVNKVMTAYAIYLAVFFRNWIEDKARRNVGLSWVMDGNHCINRVYS